MFKDTADGKTCYWADEENKIVTDGERYWFGDTEFLKDARYNADTLKALAKMLIMEADTLPNQVLVKINEILNKYE